MRLATWNLWWKFGPWEGLQERQAATLVGLDADVICLQETWPEQAERLATATGTRVVELAVGPFVPPVIHTVPPDEPFGTALLSRVPTDSPGRLRLEAPGDGAHREASAASVSLGDATITIVSAHLTHLKDGAAPRSDQLRSLTEWLDGMDTDGTILAGDLNLVPSSAEYRVGTDELGWVDTWPELHPGLAGPTFCAENPHVRSPWVASLEDGGARLDHVWRRGSAPAPRRSVRFGGSGDGWPSDHLGLLLDF